DRDLGDVERQKPRGPIGLDPLRDPEAHAQRHIEPGRQHDHRQAGPDRQLEVEPVVDDQDRGGLADHRDPAQPHQRIEAHIAPRPSGVFMQLDRHAGTLPVRGVSSTVVDCPAPRWRPGRSHGACVSRKAASDAGLMAEQGPAQEPAIAVEDLVKVYKTTRGVDGISFALSPASVTGLLGGNGAGKTTTIAMILGLLTPTSGSARVLGAEMPRQRNRVLSRMNFESPYVDMPHRLTVRQNLAVVGGLYAVADLSARITQIASELDLGEFLDRPTGQLSAGQKKRVALAKALINSPDVLLLDEPTPS